MTVRLAIGSTAPAFTLPDADGSEVSLADYAGSQVIVYFYPAALTPGCTTQALDFTSDIDVFKDAGYAVVGISPDAVEKLARFRERAEIAFALLSDPKREVISGYGAFGTKKLYGKEIEGVIRSTFVVDVGADGVGTISLAQYNVKATGHVAKLRRELGI